MRKIAERVEKITRRPTARLTKGLGWRIESTKGKKRAFRGMLIETINSGEVRLAIFSVPKELAE